MSTTSELLLVKKIRFILVVFIIGLVLSGITAFPIETQLSVVDAHLYLFPQFMQSWLHNVYMAVQTTNATYPFLSYGTDWLAFAHIVIAIAFIGPYKHPVRNIWVVQFGMIACVLVLPLALIAGEIRHIPLYWRIIDCMFGVVGFIPLYVCYRYIVALEKLEKKNF
ncbi:MAG: hypothetical protein U0Y96_01815 [Candidatus Kapaibacterium sp.]